MKESIQLALVIVFSIVMVAFLGFPYYWVYQLQVQVNVLNKATQEVVNYLNSNIQAQQQGQINSTSTIK